MRDDVRRFPAAVMLRAKVVSVALALLAAVVLVVVAWWPVKILAVAAFVGGLLAIDRIGVRHSRERSVEQPA